MYDADEVPIGAVVGTSSQRRQVQLKQLRPDLQVRDLRGNINTRLAKCAAGDYDAIILACAGLERLGLQEHIRSVLAPDMWWPAVAQGAIAVETLDANPEVSALFLPLNCKETEIRVCAERALNRHLYGSCHVPVAAYAEFIDDRLRLTGWVGDAANNASISAQGMGDAAHPDALGEFVAEKLFARGAAAMLKLPQ